MYNLKTKLFSRNCHCKKKLYNMYVLSDGGYIVFVCQLTIYLDVVITHAIIIKMFVFYQKYSCNNEDDILIV